MLLMVISDHGDNDDNGGDVAAMHGNQMMVKVMIIY